MKGRLLTSLLTALTLTSLQAQTIPVAPKLVLGITIDQLRSDYMEAFSALYGEKGFRRLLKEGRIYCSANYNFSPTDRASAVASIYTGTTPYNHGIIGGEWMDRNTLQMVQCVDDKAFMGVYTAENTSPKNLLVSTISDELKVATLGKAVVYAIAPFRDAAVFSAGHAADGAFWLNDDTGKWAGSTFYGNFPTWVIAYNDRNGLDTRIQDLVWEPYHASGAYTYFSALNSDGFKHRFTDTYRKYRNFKTSGLVNDEVNRLATTCLRNTAIGTDNITDFLAVTYYAGNFEHKSAFEYPIEIQDTYARLDRHIEELLEAAEKKVGIQNLLVFITSTGYADAEVSDYLSKYRIPTGEFYMDRCTALLNMFLMATYGQGQYVEAYNGLHIYLDQKLIEKKQLNLVQVMAKAAEFLAQFSGVKSVYTSQDLRLNAYTPEAMRMRNAYNGKCSGDIILDVAPGWKLMNEDVTKDHPYRIVRDSYLEFPLIFWGAGTKPELIHTPATVDCIAPTLAHFMRIRAPNACSVAPLTDLNK